MRRFKRNPKGPRTFVVKHVPTRTISIIVAPTVEIVYRQFSSGNRICFDSIIILDEF